MSLADREKWEPRYARGRGYKADPDPFFVGTAAGWLPPSGRALDLAGGTGRHARWLAAQGLDVTLCDISPSALAEGRALAAADGLSLHTLERDLDDGVPEGPWDVILVAFFLVGDRMAALVDQLAPGGVLLLVHPTVRNLDRHAKPSRRFLLPDGAFADGIEGLELEHREEDWGPGERHEVRLVARRPG